MKTIEDIRAMEPCYDPLVYLPENWLGTAIDILKVVECPPEDRMWVVFHVGWISMRRMQEFAIRCANRVLPILEDKYPNDDRPRRAIEAASAVLGDGIVEDVLFDAADATSYIYAAHAAYAVYSAYVAARAIDVASVASATICAVAYAISALSTNDREFGEEAENRVQDLISILERGE